MSLGFSMVVVELEMQSAFASHKYYKKSYSLLDIAHTRDTQIIIIVKRTTADAQRE